MGDGYFGYSIKVSGQNKSRQMRTRTRGQKQPVRLKACRHNGARMETHSGAQAEEYYTAARTAVV
jgi:hypothetical protein